MILEVGIALFSQLNSWPFPPTLQLHYLFGLYVDLSFKKEASFHVLLFTIFWCPFSKEGTFTGTWQQFMPIWIRTNLAQGGIVFYVDETGQHGLVAAMEDLGQFEWGCFGENVNGADGQLTHIGSTPVKCGVNTSPSYDTF